MILQGLTLDSSHHRFHELAKDMKCNKGGILAATVSYLKLLKRGTREEDVPRSAQQLDMDYDIDLTTGADPMISSVILDASPASSRSSRGSSIDFAEEEKHSLLPRRSKTCHSGSWG